MKVNVFRESKFSPSRISHSVGVNKLIQDGAHSVMSVKDIIDQLNLFMIPRQVEMQALQRLARLQPLQDAWQGLHGSDDSALAA